MTPAKRKTITLDELVLLSGRKGRIRSVAPKAERTHNGHVYHSKAEAKKAAELDLMKKCGKIVTWTSQVPFPIEVNGVYICTVIVDFRVCPTAFKGTSYLLEVKGQESEVFKLKRKLLLACYPKLDYRVEKAWR